MWNISITENIDQRDWGNYYTNLTKTKVGANLQYFQCHILTRTLVTNSNLKLFKIINEDKCSFFEEDTEYIEHMFCNCLKIFSDLWKQCFEWVQKENYNKIEMEIKFISLGPDKTDALIFTIIIIMKQIIYIKRVKGEAPTLTLIQHILKFHMTIGGYIIYCLLTVSVLQKYKIIEKVTT